MSPEVRAVAVSLAQVLLDIASNPKPEEFHQILLDWIRENKSRMEGEEFAGLALVVVKMCEEITRPGLLRIVPFALKYYTQVQDLFEPEVDPESLN